MVVVVWDGILVLCVGRATELLYDFWTTGVSEVVETWRASILEGRCRLDIRILRLGMDLTEVELAGLV